MMSTKLGLALGLLGGVAMSGAALAQSPPAPKPPAAATAPTPPPAPQAAAPSPQPPTPPQPPQQNAQANPPPAIPAPSGPPEGMIVETPNGFYLVRPGDPNPQRLDLNRGGGGQMGRNQPGMDQHGLDGPGSGPGGGPGSGPGMAQNDPAVPPMDDDAMGDMAGDRMGLDGMQPRPPRPHRPPPRPPEGKGARLHIHTPNLDVSVKCPDDEPIKACVDAISQLMDKASAAGH